MAVIIKCPICKDGTIYRHHREYAEHILEDHPDEDEGRTIWAEKTINFKPREVIKIRIKE